MMENSGSSPLASVICVVLLVLAVAGMYKVFVKAGVPGWHAIIPFLDVYELCKISLKDKVGLFTVLGILFPIVLIYPYIKLAKAFGKGTGFGVCLFLFSFVTLPMLGFGDAEYQGAQ